MVLRGHACGVPWRSCVNGVLACGGIACGGLACGDLDCEVLARDLASCVKSVAWE